MPVFVRHRAMVAFVLLAASLSGCRTTSTPADSTPDPNNSLPLGFMDMPINNATVGRMVDVVGWALDDVRVAVVRLYVDGKYNATARLTIPRPDVLKAFPQYVAANPNPGWQTTVDLGESAGAHSILAQAVDDTGATRDIGVATVNLNGR